MWYVLDAAPNARLFYGFNRDMDKALLLRSLEQGTIEQYLQSIPVQKDDIFYIPAGTVHAIGAGVLLAEIQENSNLTYRLYDYQRVDKDGVPRPLHITKALEVLNYKSSEQPRQPMRVLRYQPGCASELLCRCKYFQVERLLMNTIPDVPLPSCSTTEISFQILLCVDGEGSLLMDGEISGHKEKLPFSKGSCIFLPADSVPIHLYGKAQLLKISC
jgi:mannose-6-phosphate isomerase